MNYIKMTSKVSIVMYLTPGFVFASWCKTVAASGTSAALADMVWIAHYNASTDSPYIHSFSVS